MKNRNNRKKKRRFRSEGVYLPLVLPLKENVSSSDGFWAFQSDTITIRVAKKAHPCGSYGQC